MFSQCITQVSLHTHMIVHSERSLERQVLWQLSEEHYHEVTTLVVVSIAVHV